MTSLILHPDGGKLLRTALSKLAIDCRCRDLCVDAPGVDDCRDCMNAATALNVVFNWFHSSTCTFGNAVLCTDILAENQHSNLNIGVSLAKVSPGFFLASLGTSGNECGAGAGVQFRHTLSHGRSSTFNCCTFESTGHVWEIDTVLEINCSGAAYANSAISLGFNFHTQDRSLQYSLIDGTCSGGPCRAGGHGGFSAGGISAANGYQRLCQGESVTLFVSNGLPDGCGGFLLDGTATISLVF